MSKWLEQREKELNDFRKSKQKQFPFVIGVILMIMAFFGFMAFKNGTGDVEASLSEVLTPVILFVIVITLALVFSSRQNHKKGDKMLRENLEEILTTPEEILLFDEEMFMAPKAIIQLKKYDGELYFTEHFLVRHFGKVPIDTYKVFKLSTVKCTKTIVDHSQNTLASPGSEYITNLCGENKKVLGAVVVKGNEAYEAFINMLLRCVPDIRLGEGR